MNETFTPKTRITSIPGSSFKIQLGRMGGWVIRILRGLNIVSTVPIDEDSLVPNNIVTIIQVNLSNRFMPISPYQISRAVSQLMNDVETGWRPEDERLVQREIEGEVETTVSEETSMDSETIETSEAEISKRIRDETKTESQLEGEREAISPRMRMPTVLTLLGLPKKEKEAEETKEEAEKEAEETKEEAEKEAEETKEEERT
ncbi:MAG: hypothetical protein ACFFBS_03420 [Promethearchaeota archaeon]